MTNSKVVSQGMAEKIAGSGLAFRHLCIAFRRGKKEGLAKLLGEKRNNFVRVTRLDRIVSGIAGYIQNFFNRIETS